MSFLCFDKETKLIPLDFTQLYFYWLSLTSRLPSSFPLLFRCITPLYSIKANPETTSFLYPFQGERFYVLVGKWTSLPKLLPVPCSTSLLFAFVHFPLTSDVSLLTVAKVYVPSHLPSTEHVRLKNLHPLGRILCQGFRRILVGAVPEHLLRQRKKAKHTGRDSDGIKKKAQSR